jgi:uncharacterized membrane protein
MERTDLGRIMAFTDGVMAVAITLLVLNLEAPEVPSDELGEKLVDLVPSVLAYLLSFALVGRFWVIHHNLFETLRRFDGTLMGLNLLFLAAIAIVPFSTDLYDRNTSEPLAVAVFGAVMSLAALTHWAMTAYTLRRGFVHEHRVGDTAPFGSAVALGFTAIFLLSVPVAFVSVHAAEAIWISTIVLRYPLRRLTGRGSSS